MKTHPATLGALFGDQGRESPADRESDDGDLLASLRQFVVGAERGLDEVGPATWHEVLE